MLTIKNKRPEDSSAKAQRAFAPVVAHLHRSTGNHSEPFTTAPLIANR
jgi:hypothetical protein